MTTLLDVAVPAFTGIALQEALQWYKLSGRLPRKDVMSVLTSWSYWLFFLIVCVLGPLFIYYYVKDDPGVRQKDVAIYGAALPTFLRQFISGARSHRSQTLGTSDKYFV